MYCRRNEISSCHAALTWSLMIFFISNIKTTKVTTKTFSNKQKLAWYKNSLLNSLYRHTNKINKNCHSKLVILRVTTTWFWYRYKKWVLPRPLDEEPGLIIQTFIMPSTTDSVRIFKILSNVWLQSANSDADVLALCEAGD